MCEAVVGGVTNSVDPDQTVPLEQSDQSLHCFLIVFFSITHCHCD